MGNIVGDVAGFLGDGVGMGVQEWMNDPTGKKASERAMNSQLAQADRAMDFQREMYNQQREDLAPSRS